MGKGTVVMDINIGLFEFLIGAAVHLAGVMFWLSRLHGRIAVLEDRLEVVQCTLSKLEARQWQTKEKDKD